MLTVYQSGTAAIAKTATTFVREKVSSGPLEMKEFFRKLSHAMRDIAFEIERGSFSWKAGWAHDNGKADGIGGHILVRCGMPADFAGDTLSAIFISYNLNELYSPLRWVEIYSNMIYVLEENKPGQKQSIIRYLREASDVAGRMAAG